MTNAMYKLGSFAGNSANYLNRRRSKKLALSSYLTVEAGFTTLSIAALLSTKMYLSAILGVLLLTFLLYVTYGVLTELN